MIARIWHGWTTRANADAYEALLRSEVLPGIEDRSAGFVGAYVLRDDGEEVEFVTVTLWETADAIRAFAGEHYERAVVPPEARALLARFDERSRHYDVRVRPDE
ncbi:MAG: antibiotic biosynthesis monooxygenase [Actinomycetota bacterium]|nr:antibiotic biosynthesis monooxygenase [Actinomycetota bacterium]